MGKTNQTAGTVATVRMDNGLIVASVSSVSTVGRTKAQPSEEDWAHGVAGDGLLSHALASEVPSALQVLTTGFGMGPGVAPAR
jgi:hypothetical protein